MAFFSRAARALLSRLEKRRQVLRNSSEPAAAPAVPLGADALVLGNAALAKGELEVALQHYSAATENDPSNAKAHLNLGYARLEQMRPVLAEQSLRRALALVPASDAMAHELHYLLARARAVQSDWQAAVLHCTQVVEQDSSFAFAWRDLALAHERLGQLPQAAASMARAVALTPDALQEKLTLIRLLLKSQNATDALYWVDQLMLTLGQGPKNLVIAAQLLRTQLLLLLHEFTQAQALLEQIAAMQPNVLQTLHSMGDVLLDLHNQSDPEREIDSVKGYRCACAYLQWLECEVAVVQTLLVLALEPNDANSQINLATNYLLLGEFEQGWPKYEWRWRAPVWAYLLRYPPYPQPRWNGHESLADKTILLFPEQGLGDAIQFLRYVPMVAMQAGQVLLQLPRSLHQLAQNLAPNCTLTATGDFVPTFDFQCPIMSLPLAFGTTLVTIPNHVPYLHFPQELIERWKVRLEAYAGLRVGLVWSGNAVHANDHLRSISLAKLHAVAIPGCQFVSLQLEMRESDHEAHQQWPELLHFGSELKSFADTAALASCMDIVICVDTSVAHLVGALGLPLWILMTYLPEWRWLLNRSNSPWYPTARLFRQDPSQQWDPVLQQVKAELALMAQNKAMSQGDFETRTN